MSETIHKETHRYPVIFHQEGDVWGYHNPDFGGGGAASYEDALRLAQDLLKTAVETFREMEQELPEPTDADDIEAEGGIVQWLPVIVTDATKDIATTLPQDPPSLEF